MSNLSLVKSEEFNGVRCDFHKSENDVWMTRRQIGKSLGYSNPTASIRNIHNRNKDRVDKYSTRTKVIRVEGGREVEREMFLYSRKGDFEVCRWSQQDKANDFMDWVWEVVEEVMKTGSYSVEQYNNDINEFDVLRGMVDKLEEVSNKVEEVENNQEVLEKRLDNLDNVDIEGSLKDTLNAMVRKYALDKGKKFGVAWGEFYRNYNRAYSTNLKLRITNHKKRTGSKLTAPQLLEKDGELKDAIRVIDKMLN